MRNFMQLYICQFHENISSFFSESFIRQYIKEYIFTYFLTTDSHYVYSLGQCFETIDAPASISGK